MEAAAKSSLPTDAAKPPQGPQLLCVSSCAPERLERPERPRRRVPLCFSASSQDTSEAPGQMGPRCRGRAHSRQTLTRTERILDVGGLARDAGGVKPMSVPVFEDLRSARNPNSTPRQASLCGEGRGMHAGLTLPKKLIALCASFIGGQGGVPWSSSCFRARRSHGQAEQDPPTDVIALLRLGQQWCTGASSQAC